MTSVTSPGCLGLGFRQLADIAERALSPSINDATAVRGAQEAHGLLRRLATRPDPHRPRRRRHCARPDEEHPVRHRPGDDHRRHSTRLPAAAPRPTPAGRRRPRRGRRRASRPPRRDPASATNAGR
ncbi:DUF2254 family protein [Micromonospora sp. NPDC023888]|uniref:DUF2254 family protein n=1 Tax=Micromonospora sp. NPDC023888 TaxID=3155607 RepID=UPI0033DDA546